MGNNIQPKSRKTKIGGKTIHYEVSGSGEPLVLIHGLSGSSRWWRKNIAVFSQSYRVHIVDMVGFGRARGQQFVLKEAADLLAEWIQGIDIRPANLIGHSMGGYVTVELAAKYPHLVEHLVLVDALALPIGRSLFRNTFALMQAIRFVPFDFYPVLITDTLRAGPVTMVRAIREVLAADISQNLKLVKAPSLIVWGEHDTVLPVKLGYDLHKELPGSTLEVIERAGHNPMWDRPGRFNQVVCEFLCNQLKAVNGNGGGEAV